MRGKSAFALAISAALAGCAALKPPEMAREPKVGPDRAEITITGTSLEKALQAITDAMTFRDYYVRNLSATQAVYVKPTGSFGTKLLYSTDQTTESEIRITYRLVETANGIRITGNSEVVVNPRSVLEQSTDRNQWETVRLMQKALEQVKIKLAREAEAK